MSSKAWASPFRHLPAGVPSGAECGRYINHEKVLTPASAEFLPYRSD
jgi:hypothetical protein